MLKKIRKLFHILLNKTYLKSLLKYGVAASIEHNGLFKYLHTQNFNTIIDIGANRGQFALIARNIYPKARIISFEPLEEPASLFKKVFKKDEKVTLHPYAIGAVETTTSIHVSAADDSSSLLQISTLQDDLFPGTAEKEQRQVIVKRLDRLIHANKISQPALLKMDVQGFEMQALEGSSALLPYFSYIYVECSFVELYVGQSLAHEVIQFLSGKGFKLVGVYNLDYDRNGQAIQGDFLFKKA